MMTVITDRMENLVNDYRFEKKFHTNILGPADILDRVLSSRALFRKEHEARCVNSIYFDTPDLFFMQENLAGISNRCKVRVRWYGECMRVEGSPNIEIKVKKNALGFKYRYQLASVVKNQNAPISRLLQSVSREVHASPELLFLTSLEPKILISYRRQYFISAGGDVRLTLDSNIYFSAIDANGALGPQARAMQDDVIVELKYGLGAQDLDSIFDDLKFKFSRFSKYVVGMRFI